MKISATIITLNEARNMGDCLASLEFADEIIVVDSGSTDGTEEICRACPKVRFFHQHWLGYGKQKNRAAELAKNDMILNVDADERVTPDLRHSILAFAGQQAGAARVARRNFFGSRWVRTCGWYPDYTVRLYDRRKCSFNERVVHEAVQCDGTIVTLQGDLLHYTYRDISDYLERMNRYSTLAAEEYHKNGKKAGLGRLLVSPLAMFCKMYLIRKGFLDGWSGLVLSVLYAVYTFCKYAKLAELDAMKTEG